MLAARTLPAVRPVCVPGARRAVAVRPLRATEGQEPAPQAGTIFYAGNTYTEAEWQAAVASGKFRAPAAPASSAAAIAMPTFNEVMGFSGTGPEIINGRLAMLGFVAAVAAELSSGEGVLKQWGEEPTGIAMTFLLFIAGSLVPAFLGRSGDKLGPFTPAAEMLNGRAAMIGFAALMIVEAVKGSPLF